MREWLRTASAVFIAVALALIIFLFLAQGVIRREADYAIAAASTELDKIGPKLDDLTLAIKNFRVFGR